MGILIVSEKQPNWLSHFWFLVLTFKNNSIKEMIIFSIYQVL